MQMHFTLLISFFKKRENECFKKEFNQQKVSENGENSSKSRDNGVLNKGVHQSN